MSLFNSKNYFSNILYKHIRIYTQIIITKKGYNMIINNQINNSNNNYNYKQNFKATPKQILDKLEYAKICPGKKAYLETIGTYFERLENKMKKSSKLPSTFDYFLKKDNNLPKELAKTKVRTGFLSWTSLKSVDRELQEEAFSCNGKSNCTCGKDKSLKEFTADLLNHIGVEEPDKITLKK